MPNNKVKMPNESQSLTLKQALVFFSSAVVIMVIIFVASLLPAGQRNLSALENIDGIPYPEVDGVQLISEALAHADLYLNQPALAKELKLTANFTPYDLAALYVSVRDNSFWLSYEPVQLYERSKNSFEPHNVVVTLPLTDKLQDHDQSLDLMFIATPLTTPGVVKGDKLSIPAIETWLDNRVNDQAYWELHDVTAEVKTTWPTGISGNLQLANWWLSILRRERPL